MSSEEDYVNYEELDPGIRNTVKLLRSFGFETTDSGDGKSKFAGGTDPGCAIDIPNVSMMVRDKDQLVSESDRLFKLLKDLGVNFDIFKSTYGRCPHIESCYFPAQGGISIITLFSFDDEALESCFTGLSEQP